MLWLPVETVSEIVTATYWLTIAYLSYPLSFGAPAPYVPFGTSRTVKTRGN